MQGILWVLTILGSLFGAVVLVAGVLNANGAPQEAAAAAIGVGCAVIPYCLARAVSEFNNSSLPDTVEPPDEPPTLPEQD
jgi:NAD(P)H-hydrate repair Nnr-like enzyme with NAD(P)H-hydrate dehydratase domain